MTRSRADTAGNATDLMAEYYGARASAGLIVTEGIAPSESGKGYCRTPVLDGPSRLAGWRAVTDAVHAGGGKIVVENGESQQIFIKSVKARTPSGSEDLVTAAEVVFTGDGLEIARLPAGTTALVVVYDGSYDKNSRRYRRKNLTKSFQVGPGVTKFSIPSR